MDARGAYSQNPYSELSAFESAPVSLRAGSMELLFEPDAGWLRRIRIGNREVVRAIFGAVRDRDWRTVPTVLRDLSLQQRGQEGFEIRFIAECRSEEIHFVWKGLIAGDARGGVRFEFDGEAQSDFFRNRIGLCVLFPIAECAGEPYRVEYSDGTRQQRVFPKLICPSQPVQGIRGIRQSVSKDTALEIQFFGDIFEMEDQRNWTDASFKVYGTPLSRPFPVQVKKSDRVRQVVTLRLIPGDTAEVGAPAGTDSRWAPKDPATVEVNFQRLRPKPAIGLGWGGDCELLHSNAKRRLQALNLDHLRVDCRLWEADWKTRLGLADGQAVAIDAGLHIALFFSEKGEAELRELVQAATRLVAPVRLWLVFDGSGKCTAPDWVMRARNILTPASPKAKFAAGTDAYFAELNRNRPPSDADWLPCCSISPQVHASDVQSLVENLAAQTDVVKTAREFSRQPLVISPITLLPRGNPNASRVTLSRMEPPADPRQASLFTAGWTLGSLAAVTASHPVHSLTYYEAVGPRGIIASVTSVFPVYHVFAGIGDFTQLAEARLIGVSSPLQLATLAGVTRAGRAILWLANLTAKSLNVRLQTTPGFRSVLIKQLNEHSAAEATQQPEQWLRMPDSCTSLDAGPSVDLPRYGLARLEMEP